MAVIDLSKLSFATRIQLATELTEPEALEELADVELSESQHLSVLLRIIANSATNKETLQKIADNAKDESVRVSVYRKL